jgi:uncharacterized protein with beta-barrel porin domain
MTSVLINNTKSLFATLLCVFILFVSVGAKALEIVDATTDSIETSTADAGVAGDVLVSSDGSISLEDDTGLPAIRLNSDNTITIEGTVEVLNTDAIQALVLEGGNTSTLTLSGLVQVVEDYVREDTDADGDFDGAYALGGDRIGVHVSGVAPLVSDLILESSGILYVEGNSSQGIQLDTQLQGNITNFGNITVVGENSTAININAEMIGDLSQVGEILTLGEAIVGIQINQAVTGSVSNSGSVVSSGFFSNTVSNYIEPSLVTENTLPLEERIDAEELLVGGSALQVHASVSEGLLNNGVIDTFLDATELADDTKDTAEDFDENRSAGSLSTFGSAPTLRISALVDGTTDDLVLGAVVEDVLDTLDDDSDLDTSEVLATLAFDYGLLNRGSIAADGLNEGFSATAISISGATDGSRSVVIEGGLFNSGSISADAVEGNATSIYLGDFTQLDTLINEGSIGAQSESTTATQAIAVQISNQGQLNSLINSGVIVASSLGDDAAAIAIQDASGTLASIENRGAIAANATIRDEIGLSSAVAIDLSTHSAAQPIFLLQERLTPTDDINGDGEIDNDDVRTPSILGDIYFGAGADTANLSAGTITASTFDFGAGVDELLLSGNASMIASVQNLENLSLDTASLEITSVSPTTLESLDLINDSNLTITLDLNDIDPAIAQIQVAGNAVIDASSTITTKYVGFQNDLFSALLIEAADLNFGDLNLALELEVPAIYTQVVTANNTSVSIAIETKTATDLGLQESYQSSFDALLGLAEEIEGVGTRLTSYVDEADLQAAYAQLLPDSSGLTASFLAAQLDLSTSMTGNRLEHIGVEGAGNWFEHTIGRGAQASIDQNPSHSGTEVNFAAGFDQELVDDLYLGLSLGLRTSRYTIDNLNDHEIRSTSFDLGIYSGYGFGAFSFNNSLTFGNNTQYSDRTVDFGDTTEEYSAEWSGNYYAGSSLISYQKNFGNWFLRPSVALDYFYFSEEDYSETFESDTGDLALSVAGTDSTQLSSTIKLNLGSENWRSGAGSSKQIYFGYRADAGSDTYASTASFMSGQGYEFDIRDDRPLENALIFGFNLTARSVDGNSITVGYSGEKIGDFTRNLVQGEIRIGI